MIQLLWWPCCLDMLLKPNLAPNFKVGLHSFRCSLAFSLYHLCASSRLDTNWVWTYANHVAQFIIVGFMTLCTPLISNLGCKPWFAKNNVCWVDECIMLLQTFPWPNFLTCKYCFKTWLTCYLCPSFGGRKLMTTSFSHL